MKANIHPKGKLVEFVCACGNHMQHYSTAHQERIRIDVCGKCHPHYSGNARVVDTLGNIDKFFQRFGQSSLMKDQKN